MSKSFSLNQLTEGIRERHLGADTSRLVSKWTRTGLLRGLNENKRENMARMLENQASQLLREANILGTSSSSPGNINGFSNIAFPIVRRVFGGLVANELVSIQPMSLPSGLLFYLDYTDSYSECCNEPQPGDTAFVSTKYNFVDNEPINGENCYQFSIFSPPGFPFGTESLLSEETCLDFVDYLEIRDFYSPTIFTVHQSFPNPFNPITTLRYDLPSDALVTLSIYDMLGRTVVQLVNTTQKAGFKSVQWDATDSMGRSVSAGVYLYQIQTGEFVQTKKMVLLK